MAAKKKSKVKKLPKEKNKCREKGCNRVAREDGYCKKCFSSKSITNEEGILQLTEIDRLKFLEIDQALLNFSQEIKLLDQEQRIDDFNFNQRRNTRNTRINELKNNIRDNVIKQKVFLGNLSEKYGFNPSISSIDDKTGVIHQLESQKSVREEKK